MPQNHLEGLFYDDANDILAIFYHKHNLSVTQMKDNAIRKHHIQSPARGFSQEDVIALAITPDGHILAGTEDNGVYEMTPNHKIRRNILPTTTATSVICDSKGNVWTGLYRQGLVDLHGNLLFKGQSPMKIIEPVPGLLFVILNSEGLWTLDTSTRRTQHIPTSNPWLMDMTSDGLNVYAATPDMLYIIDAKTLNVKTVEAKRFKSGHFKDGNKTILADRRGWVWMVNYKCGADIDVYDSRRQTAFSIHMTRDIIINAIAEDCKGDVWLASNLGLMRIAVTDEKKHLTETALFPFTDTYFNDKATFTSKDGLMLFGTTNGYISVDTRNINLHPTTPLPSSLILSAMRINNNYIPADADSVDNASCALPFMREITLPHDKNNIWIELAPRNFNEPCDVYHYKVEGLSDIWMPLDRNGIQMANLAPGTYHVMLRRDTGIAQDSNNDFLLQQILTVVINPPFYRSTWAYIIYLLIVIAIVILSVTYIRQKRETKKKIEELYRKLQLHQSPQREETDMAPADRQLLDAAIKIVEENISNPDFSVDELSAQLCMHRTNLYKRWAAITGVTPLHFIRLLRLRHGKFLLEQGAKRVSDVAYRCGFNDPKKFSKYFKEEFGMSPSEYIK